MNRAVFVWFGQLQLGGSGWEWAARSCTMKVPLSGKLWSELVLEAGEKTAVWVRATLLWRLDFPPKNGVSVTGGVWSQWNLFSQHSGFASQLKCGPAPSRWATAVDTDRVLTLYKNGSCEIRQCLFETIGAALAQYNFFYEVRTHFYHDVSTRVRFCDRRVCRTSDPTLTSCSWCLFTRGWALSEMWNIL